MADEDFDMQINKLKEYGISSQLAERATTRLFFQYQAP